MIDYNILQIKASPLYEGWDSSWAKYFWTAIRIHLYSMIGLVKSLLLDFSLFVWVNLFSSYLCKLCKEFIVSVLYPYFYSLLNKQLSFTVFIFGIATFPSTCILVLWIQISWIFFHSFAVSFALIHSMSSRTNIYVQTPHFIPEWNSFPFQKLFIPMSPIIFDHSFTKW